MMLPSDNEVVIANSRKHWEQDEIDRARINND
jgi:hypothetical protein